MIKSIEIEISGETLKLSPEDAKSLYGELHELFGTKEAVRWYPNWQWNLGGTWYQPTNWPTITSTGTNDRPPFHTSGYMRIND